MFFPIHYNPSSTCKRATHPLARDLSVQRKLTPIGWQLSVQPIAAQNANCENSWEKYRNFYEHPED